MVLFGIINFNLCTPAAFFSVRVLESCVFAARQHSMVEMEVGMRSFSHTYMLKLLFYFLDSGSTSFLYTAFFSSTL